MILNCSVGNHQVSILWGTAGGVFFFFLNRGQRHHIYTKTAQHNTQQYFLVRIIFFPLLFVLLQGLLHFFFFFFFSPCSVLEGLHWPSWGRMGWYRMKPEKWYLRCHQMVIILTQYTIGLYCNSNAAFVTKHRLRKAVPGYCNAFQAYILAGFLIPHH